MASERVLSFEEDQLLGSDEVGPFFKRLDHVLVHIVVRVFHNRRNVRVIGRYRDAESDK